jgi:maltose alpha-D-glucosyltransferase/alpha-amylase
MPKWLEKTIFYEIYPQSFYDANGDGIGDLEGIIQKLNYIQGLGCNGLWLNPCFDSPFKDAGYDVRDYKKVAPRYGSNEDLFRLFEEAHKRDMKVLLDLVPGHTSEEHEWFLKSKQAEPNEFSARYIWTDSWISWGLEGFRFIAGESERNGVYIINFFKCQPALNYGVLNPKEPWQLPPEHGECTATREALKDIMRFWLKGGRGRGCDGFRVDMADSLVKNDDPQKSATSKIWRNVREMLDAEFPEAALISEWSSPGLSLKAGFHGDFLLDHEGSGYKSLVRDFRMDRENRLEGPNNSFFKKDGAGDITRFLSQYLPWYGETKSLGYICLITGNHDTPRISFGLEPRELALAYAVLFTLPGVPFLYYGDEIGMRYLKLPTKEGGYTRTGSRTPMQWSTGKNMGFSAAGADQLYLPLDTGPGAPSVEAQEKDSGSLLNTVKALFRLRRAEADLGALPNLEILFAEKERLPFVYRRGAFIAAVNPGGVPAEAPVAARGSPVYVIGGASLEGGRCRLDAQSFGIWKT